MIRLSITYARSDTKPGRNPASWKPGSLFEYVDSTIGYAVGFVGPDGQLYPITDLPDSSRSVKDQRADLDGRSYGFPVEIGPLTDCRPMTRFYTGSRRRDRRRRSGRPLPFGREMYAPVSKRFYSYLTDSTIAERVEESIPSFRSPESPTDDAAALTAQLDAIPADEIDVWLGEFGLTRERFDEEIEAAAADTPFSFPETERVIGHGVQPSQLKCWYIEPVSTPGQSWTDPWSGTVYTASINGRVDPDCEVYGCPDKILELLAKERRLGIRRIIDDLDLRFRHRSWAEDRYHRAVWEAIIEHELKRRLRSLPSTGDTDEGLPGSDP